MVVFEGSHSCLPAVYLSCPGGIQQYVLTACSAVLLHREPLALWGQRLSDFLTTEMNKWKDLSNVSVDFADHFSTTLQLPIDQYPAEGLIWNSCSQSSTFCFSLSALLWGLELTNPPSAPKLLLVLSSLLWSDVLSSSFLFSVVVCFVSACAKFLVCITFPLLAPISVPLGCPVTAVSSAQILLSFPAFLLVLSPPSAPPQPTSLIMAAGDCCFAVLFFSLYEKLDKMDHQNHKQCRVLQGNLQKTREWQASIREGNYPHGLPLHVTGTFWYYRSWSPTLLLPGRWSWSQPRAQALSCRAGLTAACFEQTYLPVFISSLLKPYISSGLWVL